MSDRSSLELILSPQASEDIAGILEYTRSEWGQHQRLKYRSELIAGFGRLCDFPGLGRPYPEFGVDGARTYPIREHVAVFSVEGRELGIWRVFHPREDRRRWLSD